MARTSQRSWRRHRAPCKLEAVVLSEGVREQLAVQAHIGYEKHANAFSSAAA